MVVLLFFLLNTLFYILFNYKISRFLRKFSFKFTLFMMLLNNNIVYLAYASFHNVVVFFSFKFQDKLGQVIWILILYGMVLLSVAGFFLIYYLHEKLSKYFLDDNPVKV